MQILGVNDRKESRSDERGSFANNVSSTTYRTSGEIFEVENALGIRCTYLSGLFPRSSPVDKDQRTDGSPGCWTRRGSPCPASSSHLPPGPPGWLDYPRNPGLPITNLLQTSFYHPLSQRTGLFRSFLSLFRFLLSFRSSFLR